VLDACDLELTKRASAHLPILDAAACRSCQVILKLPGLAYVLHGFAHINAAPDGTFQRAEQGWRSMAAVGLGVGAEVLGVSELAAVGRGDSMQKRRSDDSNAGRAR
jgi:hypothetical protein